MPSNSNSLNCLYQLSAHVLKPSNRNFFRNLNYCFHYVIILFISSLLYTEHRIFLLCITYCANHEVFLTLNIGDLLKLQGASTFSLRTNPLPGNICWPSCNFTIHNKHIICVSANSRYAHKMNLLLRCFHFQSYNIHPKTLFERAIN